MTCTLFAYSLEDLDKQTELLSAEMAKTLIGLRPAWAMQEEAFQTNMPFCENKVKETHTFDRRSMSTVFPFFSSDIGHEQGIPLGLIGKQDFQYYLITLVQHLLTTIWLYLENLVLVKVLQ